MIIRIKGVKRVRSRGKIYYYHRKTGTSIDAAPGTLAFLRKLDELNGIKAPEAEDAKAGTLAGLMAAYRGSPEFSVLKDRTKADYQKVMDYLKPLGHLNLNDTFDEAAVLKIRDRCYDKRKRHFANYVVKVLRLIFEWGKPRKWITVNVARGVKLIRKAKGSPRANRAWSDEEFAVVMAEATPSMRVAVALAAYAGLREGNVIRFPKSGYNGKAIEAKQEKTDDPIWVPAHRELRAILDVWDPRDSLLIVVGEKGRPYKTESGFRSMFFGLIRRLKKEGKVAHGLTFHGLRHTVGKKLAEAGCTKEQIKAVLGHKSDAAANIYIEEASRKMMATAAMKKFEGPKQKQKVENART